MHIVGVCGRKGGSGKTTTAVHLAAELSTRGLSVALVDCDVQGSAKHWSAPGQLPMPVHHRPLELGQNVSQWKNDIRAVPAEIVILDSPPHLDAALGGVIGLSDVAVIPCGPSGLDLMATAEAVELVREIRKARGSAAPFITLVPNRLDPRTSSGRQLESALGEIGEDVSPAVHYRTAFSDSFNAGAWVGSYAPGSAAHLETQALTTHISKLLGLRPGKKHS